MAGTLLQVVNALYPQATGGVESYTGEVAHALGGAVLSLTPHPDPATDAAWQGLHVFAPSPGEGALAAWHRTLAAVEPAAVFVQHLGSAHPGMLLDLRERGIPYAVFLHDFGPVCPTLRLWHRRQEPCSGPGRTGFKCALCVSGDWRRAAELPLRALLYRHRPQDWRTALIRAEVLVAPSRFARDYWIAQGAPPERLVVLAPVLEAAAVAGGDGAMTTVAAPLIEMPRHGSRRRLLYAGGADEASGAELLGAALDQIRLPVELIAAGSLSSEARRQLRAAIPARHGIQFAGQAMEESRAGISVPSAAIPALAAACAATVVPSRWDLPFSPVIWAAQSVGATVVATAVGGLTEQIIHGVNGYLAAPDDPTALAESLQEALSRTAWPEGEPGAWGGERVAVNARGEAQHTRDRLGRLLSLLATGSATDPAVLLEHGSWLQDLGADHPLRENTEALISALRLEGIGGSVADSRFRQRARAASRARRVHLNHAIAFFRGCGCRRIVHLGDPDPSPDAVAWFAAWGLESVDASSVPDGVFEDRGECADAEWLRRRFHQARAWASATPAGVEVQAWAPPE